MAQEKRLSEDHRQAAETTAEVLNEAIDRLQSLKSLAKMIEDGTSEAPTLEQFQDIGGLVAREIDSIQDMLFGAQNSAYGTTPEDVEQMTADLLAAARESHGGER